MLHLSSDLGLSGATGVIAITDSTILGCSCAMNGAALFMRVHERVIRSTRVLYSSNEFMSPLGNVLFFQFLSHQKARSLQPVPRTQDRLSSLLQFFSNDLLAQSKNLLRVQYLEQIDI